MVKHTGGVPHQKAALDGSSRLVMACSPPGALHPEIGGFDGMVNGWIV
jgi:hypothetical protein